MRPMLFTLLAILVLLSLHTDLLRAEVYLNRQRGDDGYFHTLPLELYGQHLKLDRGYQNDYGTLYGLTPGPPFIIEAPIIIGKVYDLNGRILSEGSLTIEGFGGGAQGFELRFVPVGTSDPGIVIMANGDLSVLGDGFDRVKFVGPFKVWRTAAGAEDSADVLIFKNCDFELDNVGAFNRIPFELSACNVTFDWCSFNGMFETFFAPIDCIGNGVSSTLLINRCDFHHLTLIGAYVIRAEYFAPVTLKENSFRDIILDESEFSGVAKFLGCTIREISGNYLDGFVEMGAIHLGGITHIRGESRFACRPEVPLVVEDIIVVEQDSHLRVESGTILKHYDRQSYAQPTYTVKKRGSLKAQGAVFTSHWDDAYGGDTNLDGAPTTISRWGMPTVAISVEDSALTEFRTCVIRYPEGGIRAQGDLTVDGCVIESASEHAIRIGGEAGLRIYSIKNSTITGTVNRTYGPGSAIVVENSAGFRQGVGIENDTLLQNQGDGVTVLCSGSMPTLMAVERCWIAANGGMGINVTANAYLTRLTIQGNSILANGSAGISVNAAGAVTTHTDVEGNLIAGNGFLSTNHGAYVGVGTSRFVNNTAAMNNRAGIATVPASESDALCANNILYRNQFYGLMKVPTVQNVVASNTFWQNQPAELMYRSGAQFLYTVEALQDLGGDFASNIHVTPGFPASFTARIGLIRYFTDRDLTALVASDDAFRDKSFDRRLIRPDRSQGRSYVVSHLHEDTLFVWGDARTVAGVGDTCEVFDFHLTEMSLAIDAGRNDAVTVEKDMDAQSRIVDGNKDHYHQVDLGADEFYPDSVHDGPITILHPGSQERWIAGEPNDVRWKSTDIPFVDIDVAVALRPPDPPQWVRLVSRHSASTEYFRWNLPDTLISAKCQIRIRSADDTALFARSELFRIKPYVLTRLTREGEYEVFMPDFDGWRFSNIEEYLWPEFWWNQFDYENGVDPYTRRRYPPAFADSTMYHAHPWEFPDWPLFVGAFSEDSCYYASPIGKWYSRRGLLGWFVTKRKYYGSCVGFSVSSLLRYFTPEALQAEFPDIDTSGYLSDVPLSDENRLVINTLQTRRHSAQIRAMVKQSQKPPLDVLRDLRVMLASDTGSPYALTLRGDTIAHQVVPFQILKSDTVPTEFEVRVYEPNAPGNLLATVCIDTSKDLCRYTQWPLYDSLQVNLEGPVSMYLSRLVLPQSTAKTILAHMNKGPQSSPLALYLSEASAVTIQNDLGQSIGHFGGKAFNTMPDAMPIFPVGTDGWEPLGYEIPDGRYAVALSCGRAPERSLALVDGQNAYWFRRFDASSSQLEQFAIDHGIGIANPNAESMRARLTTIITASEQERVIELGEMVLTAGDSLHALVMQGELLRIDATGSSRTYTLRLERVTPQGEAMFLSNPVHLQGNSTHWIEPTWSDPLLRETRILIDLDSDGTVDDTTTVPNQLVGIIESGGEIPSDFTLDQNYPNPFNSETVIRFGIPRRSRVTLEVYNILGERVAMPVDDVLEPGRKEIRFVASSLASGMYIYRLAADGCVRSRKMVVVR